MDIREILELSKYLDTTFTSLKISVCLIDKNQQVLWVNEQGHNIFGQLDDIRGQVCREVCPCFWEDSTQVILDRVINTGSIGKYVYPYPETDKKAQYFRYLFIPLKNTENETEYIIVIHMPLSEPEGSQWDQRLMESHLTNLAQTAADAIVALDREGLIQFWNKGAEIIFGYSAEEVIGRLPDFIIPEKLRKEGELTWLLNTTESEGAIVNYETERLTKDGRNLIAEITRTVLKDEEGNILGSSAVIKDITDRKKIEEELKFTVDELSKLNQIADYLHGSKDLREIYKSVLVGVTAGEGFKYNRAFLLLIDQEQNLLKGYLAVGPGTSEEASNIWSALSDYQRLEKALAG